MAVGGRTFPNFYLQLETYASFHLYVQTVITMILEGKLVVFGYRFYEFFIFDFRA